MANDRNIVLKKNILMSAVLKMVGLATSLLIVPITIGYLDKEVYGVWMTMTSVLFWIGTFDIGLGNGMRNYLTEAISKQDYSLARKYICTTFSLLTVIALALGVIGLLPLSQLDYCSFFNTHAVSGESLRNATLVAIGFTLGNFVLKNVGFIFVAMQKYAVNDLLTVSGNVISMVIIFILTKVTSGNLMYVVLAYTATTCAVFALATIPLFLRYPELRPAANGFDKSLGRQIVGKGMGFFVIQVSSCLVIFGAANVFIAQNCGPTNVTTYNIAYKFFNLLIIAYTIILSPMWNAYTDAYVKGDMAWINATFNRALKFWALSVAGGACMLAVSGVFYHLWVGDKVEVPLSISLCTFVYVCAFNLNNCATYLINGLNKIRVQILTSVVFTILYVAMVKFTDMGLSVESIVLSMATCYLAMALIHIYQCRLLIRQKATGIWDR